MPSSTPPGPQLRIVANAPSATTTSTLLRVRRRGVLVTNTPGVLTDATADIAMALILMVTRRLGEGERVIRSRSAVALAHALHARHGPAGQDARHRRPWSDRHGHGTAGARIRHGDHLQRPAPRRRGARGGAGSSFFGFDDLLGRATSSRCTARSRPRPPPDHARAPRADAQRRLPRQHDARARRGRGRARRGAADGVIKGAGLDVFEHEPDVHPGLLELENVVLIPHLGSATIETRTAMAVLAARNAAAVLGGERAADARARLR